MTISGVGGTIDDGALQTRLGYKVFHAPQDFPLIVSATPQLSALGAGVAEVAEILAAGEIPGLAMDTADEVYVAWRPPWEMDRERDIWLQVGFYVQGASETGIDWAAWVKGIAEGEALTDAKVAANKNIVFPAQANTLAAELVITPPVAMGFALGSDNEIKDDDQILIALELDDRGTAGAGEVVLAWLQVYYTVQFSDARGFRQLT